MRPHEKLKPRKTSEQHTCQCVSYEEEDACVRVRKTEAETQEEKRTCFVSLVSNETSLVSNETA
jgi:hypothetical protein